MRYNVLRKHSTKEERIFYEVLKELKIPFRHRWIIDGREIDFVIFDNVAIEIDGHEQDGRKNQQLVELGYTPIHLNNSEVTRENIIRLLKEIKK